MEIKLERKVNKSLDRQMKGDPKGIGKVKRFLQNYLEKSENPTQLPNCKKMAGIENHYRWRVGNYRIVAEVKKAELIILIIEIAPRGSAYKK